jgi:hypothetical protein
MPGKKRAPGARRLLISALFGLLVAAPGAQAFTGNISTIVGDGTSGTYGQGDGGPASAARVSLPVDVTGLPDGGYLIAEQGTDVIRRVSASGIITTIAGSGGHNYTGDGGAATSATMSAVNGAQMLPDGRILIADFNNNAIRQVGLDGKITTVAGGHGQGSSGDGGPATSAQLFSPTGLAVLSDGSYLIADKDNHRVRKVDASGTISTVAGTGSPSSGPDGGQASATAINGPDSVAATSDGGYLIAEENGFRIRKVAPDGTISTVAGTGLSGFSGDGGPATSANMGSTNMNLRVVTMPDGGFIISDAAAQRVRRVAPDGTITTIAGTGTAGYNGDGIPGAQAQVNFPYGASVTAEGDVIIADGQGERIRLVDIADPPPPPPPPPPPANIPTTLTLAPKSANRTPGAATGVTATVKLRDGSAATNTPIRFTITGVNAGRGQATTNAGGTAAVSWDGVHDGADSVRAWVDLNNNGQFDFGEPADTATITWVLPAPTVAKTVNIEPVKGKVFVKLPKKKNRVGAAQSSGFIPLDEAKNVPVGTIVDTHQGTVELTSAATLNVGGATQASQFFNGDFQIKQARSKQPITELVLNDKLTCSSKKKVGAAAARSRQLWGHGKGRFRTRGRHSTATVRGTFWLTKDTCDTTLTVVREGVVTVHDVAKNRDVKVKAGKRYIARGKKKNKKK